MILKKAWEWNDNKGGVVRTIMKELEWNDNKEGIGDPFTLDIVEQ